MADIYETFKMNQGRRLSKYEKFDDKRPLTDETLEELGLWWNKDSYELDTELGTFYTTPKDKDCTKDANCKCDNEQYLYHFKNKKVVWKTVGSVRMLIEALKGEIK